MSAKITKALHQVMSKVGYIQKTGNNKFHNYKYAGEADLLEKLRPAMLEAGLLLIPSVETVTSIDENGITTVRMEYTLAHVDGDVWPHKIGAAGQGGDKNSKGGVGDKGLYKAITGANKYLLFKLFQIETGEDPEQDQATDDSAALFVAECRQIIRDTPADRLGEWWNSDEQKQARRDFDLNQAVVDELKALVIAKINTLKTDKAA